MAADDGFIRDVGEISRAFKVSPATDRVLTLVADYLADHAAGPVEVFYDAPLSLSGELARRTREIFASRGLDGPGRGGAGAGAAALGLSRGHRHQRHRLDRRPRDRGGPGRGDHPAASGLAAHRSEGTGARGGGIETGRRLFRAHFPRPAKSS